MFLLWLVPLLILIVLHKFRKNNRMLLRFYQNHNVLCFGPKGSGKDIIMQHACRMIGLPHYSTVKYSPLTTVKSLSWFSVPGLTFENFIDGTIPKGVPKHYKEGYNFWCSDIGVYAPSQYYTLLDKKYKGVPVAMALSRQLWDCQFHANTQDYGRPWDKIREQFSGFIKCRGTLVIGRLAFTSIILYDKAESAEQSLLPFPCPLLAKAETKALARQFEATNGRVESMLIAQILPKRNSCYDSRYFHKKVYGYGVPLHQKVHKSKVRKFKDLQKGPIVEE